MRTFTESKSKRALDLAIADFGGGPTVSMLVLFFALSKRLADALGDEEMSEISYRIADELATKGRP